MPSPWGSALMSLGKTAEKVGGYYADEDKRKREEQEALARLAQYRAGTEAQQLKNEEARGLAERRGEYLGRLGQRQKDLAEAETYTEDVYNKTPWEPDVIARNEELQKLKQMPTLGQIQKYGLDVDKEYVPGESLRTEAKKPSSGMLGTYFNQRLEEAKRYYKSKNPSMSDEQVSNMAWEAVQAPSFSVQTTPEGLGKTSQLSEARKLGGLTPTVQEKEVSLAGKKAAATGAGSTMGKEGAEQNILGGKIFTDLEPIPGIRQSEKAHDKIRKAKPAMETLKKSMDDLVKKYNEVGWSPLGKDAAELKQAVRMVQLFSKESSEQGGLFNLGVLNGKDLDILEEVINNPSSFRDGATLLRYGKDKYKTTFRNLQDFIDYKIEQFYKTNGQRRPTFDTPEAAEAAGLDPGTLIYVGGRKAVIE